MPKLAKARVFMSGRSQAVRIPAEFRFSCDEVYVRRDARSGGLILSQSPGGWQEVFAVLDEAAFPVDFMADREQGAAEVAESPTRPRSGARRRSHSR